MKTIEELEAVLEEAKKDLEELKKNKNTFEPTPRGWVPKIGEKYWIASISLKPVSSNNEKFIDDEIIKYNRIFQTEEECQLYCDIQRAFRNASRDFTKEKHNYFLSYDYFSTCLRILWTDVGKKATLYFDSKEEVEKLIDKFGEENVKKYYLGVY